MYIMAVLRSSGIGLNSKILSKSYNGISQLHTAIFIKYIKLQRAILSRYVER